MDDLIGIRVWFVSGARYTYRGLVTEIYGSIAKINNCSKVIDLGDGTRAPNEEIMLPDGWRIDLAACEAFGPEPASWTRK